jgi:hypothetical protein
MTNLFVTTCSQRRKFPTGPICISRTYLRIKRITDGNMLGKPMKKPCMPYSSDLYQCGPPHVQLQQSYFDEREYCNMNNFGMVHELIPPAHKKRVRPVFNVSMFCISYIRVICYMNTSPPGRQSFRIIVSAFMLSPQLWCIVDTPLNVNFQLSNPR